MKGFQQYEKDERHNMLQLLDIMNKLHANMGGRDTRPERVALSECMRIITKELERSAQVQIGEN